MQKLHRPAPKTLLPIEFATPYGDVAQLVERLLCKQEVVGSIPIVSTQEMIRDQNRSSSNAIYSLARSRQGFDS